MKRAFTLVTALIIAPLALSACGGDTKTASPTTAAASSATSAAPTSSAPAPTSAPVTSAAAAKLDANKASEEDMTKAFIAAGIKEAPAKKWADEVKEYRPYTKADLNSKISSKLGKYQIPAADLAIVLKTLEVK